MKKIVVFLIILAVGIAIGVYLQKQPKARQIETEMQTGAEKAGADVKAGVQKADAVAADVKEDAHKAGEMATNVAGEVKAGAKKAVEAATNVVDKIK